MPTVHSAINVAIPNLLTGTFAGSQSGYRFQAPGGSMRTLADMEEPQSEFEG